MRTRFGTMLAGLLWSVSVAMVGCGQPAQSTVQLSGAAKQTLERSYPDAKVQKVNLETEDGQRLYEVKMLKDGSKLEVTLAEDGTIVEIESPVAAADLPKAVTDAVAKAAPGAKIEKATKQESLTDSKLNKLTPPKMSYEVEVEQDDKEAELTVAADGTILEPLKWQQEQKEEKGQKEDAND